MTNLGASKDGVSVPTERSSTFRAIVVAIVVIAAVSGAAILGTWWRSNQPESWYSRGRNAIQAGDPETARRLADQLIQTPGYEPQGRLLRGLLLVRSGLYNEALVQLEPASRHELTAVEADSVAANCLYAMGRYLETIETAQAALRLDPHCLDAMRWLAAAYYDLGAVSHAVTELEKLKVEAPSDPRPDRLLGLIAKDGEQFPLATKHYAESLRRDPKQPERELILLEMAESQVALSEFDEALETLSKCKRSAASLTLESSCQRGLGQVEKAMACIRQAVEMDTRHFPAKMLQGKLYLDGSDWEKGVEVTKQAIEIDPHNSKVHLQLSQGLRQCGRVEEADSELKTMMDIQALERQFSDLHDQAAKQPSDARIRCQIGDLARRLGKPELAKLWFRAALAIDPAHAEAAARLREMMSGAKGDPGNPKL